MKMNSTPGIFPLGDGLTPNIQLMALLGVKNSMDLTFAGTRSNTLLSSSSHMLST